MNVTVINIRDLFKYVLVLIISILIIVTSTRFFYNKNTKIETQNLTTKKSSLLTCLKLVIPMIDYKQEDTIQISNEIDIKKTNILTKILNIELGLIDNIGEKSDINNMLDNNQKNNEENNNKTSDEIELAKTDLQTQEVTENNIQPSYTDSIDDIQIKNQSSYAVTRELIEEPFKFSNTKDFIIFHTHTCESYTQTENFTYTPSGEYRTTDLNYSVARVGDELERQLTEYGYNVIHDKTYHDYPAYTGSYDRSLKTVQYIINDRSSTAEIVIDLHRDAVGSSGEYGPSVMIGNEKVAQLMFVIGTDGGGLYHPNWQNNLRFAVTVQRKANEMYPGLFRPIILRDSRYNQHLTSAACIIEVGATGNTMEETLASMKYLAKVMSEVVK